MAVIRTTRFTVDPTDVDEMIAKRAELIAAVRAAFAGLTEARLARVDEKTWVDAWRWVHPRACKWPLPPRRPSRRPRRRSRSPKISPRNRPNSSMRANAQPSGPALLIPADLRGTLRARRRARTIPPLPRFAG
jgi:hypothetical protein